MSGPKIGGRSAGLSAAIIISGLLTGGASPETKQTVFEREAPLSQDELEADTEHLDSPRVFPGADRTVAPAPATEEELLRHGVFRIVPEGFVGQLTYADDINRRPPGLVTNSLDEVRESPLFVSVDQSLPAGFALVSADTFDGDTNTVIRQIIKDKSGERVIEVTRARKGRTPIDVLAPAEDATSAMALSLIFVEEHEGILLSPTDHVPPNLRITVVQFYADGVTTTITADDISVGETLRLADAVAAGAMEVN
jgi:hypothetical protein